MTFTTRDFRPISSHQLDITIHYLMSAAVAADDENC